MLRWHKAVPRRCGTLSRLTECRRVRWSGRPCMAPQKGGLRARVVILCPRKRVRGCLHSSLYQQKSHLLRRKHLSQQRRYQQEILEYIRGHLRHRSRPPPSRRKLVLAGELGIHNKGGPLLHVGKLAFPLLLEPYPLLLEEVFVRMFTWAARMAHPRSRQRLLGSGHHRDLLRHVLLLTLHRQPAGEKE